MAEDHAGEVVTEQDLELARRKIRLQSTEIGPARVFVTCPDCRRRVDVCRTGYRCRQCGVVYCGSCALEHFGLEIYGELGRVRRRA